MAPPMVNTRPVRAFTLLPSTGYDKNASPILCNLARVATIVPANPLPLNLFPRVGEAAGDVTNRRDSGQKRKFEEVDPYSFSDDKISAQSKKLEGWQEPSSRPTTTGEKKPEADEEFLVKVQIQNAPATNATSANAAESLLKAENEKLKHENEALKKNICLFRQILKNESTYNIAVKKARELQLTVTSLVETVS